MGPTPEHAEVLSTAPSRHTTTGTTDEREEIDVVTVRLDDGGLLLSETENEAAWIESDVAIVFP